MLLLDSAVIELAPQRYRQPLVDTLKIFKITNPAEFLATVYYESGYLFNLTENLNYTCDALLKRFTRKRISYEDAMRMGRSNRHPAYQEAIANTIYEGKWGLENLGNLNHGDGWHFRGQGAIPLIGRENWNLFGKFLDRPDIGDNPTIALEDPLITCYAAGWYWTNLKKLCLYNSDMRAITRRVTGAPDTAIKTRIIYRTQVQQLIAHA